MNRLTSTGSRLAVAALIGLVSQIAFAGESPADTGPAQQKERPFTDQQIEAESKAYRDALHRRLAEDLAEKLKEIEAPRIDVVLVENSTRG